MASIRYLFCTVACVFSLGELLAGEPAATAAPPKEPMSLWFDKPGPTFMQSCVIGNGRLGAMDLGGVEQERLVLNESSLWSGGPYDGNKYESVLQNHRALSGGSRERPSGEDGPDQSV